MSELHLFINLSENKKFYKKERKREGERETHRDGENTVTGIPIWSNCMFAVAIDLIVHHIRDILRLKKAENSSGQHPFVYQRRRTSASSDTLSR